MTNHEPPFSARHRGKHQQINEEFPDTARSALLHLLYDLADREYVESWGALARELHRIGRLRPQEYVSNDIPSIKRAKNDAESCLMDLPWDRAFDFCERLYGHLAQEVGYEEQFGGFQTITPRSEVQVYIATELQRLFLEENLAYEFTEGIVLRRGRKHNVEVVSRAKVVLGDTRLSGARKHYIKALQFYRAPNTPDYENAIKEAVCACEAAGLALFPDAKAKTLGDLSKWLANTRTPPIPKAIANSITSIYAFRSGGEGIGHGGATGGTATSAIAEYVLATCASQIIYLVDLANDDEDDIPF